MAGSWRSNPIDFLKRQQTTDDTSEPLVIYWEGDTGKKEGLKLTTEGKLTVKSVAVQSIEAQSIKAQSIEDTSGGSLVPVGAILMWSGPADKIPEGWVLCDGQNGTPNLVERFIRGTSGKEGTPQVGGSGGDANHTHTVFPSIEVLPGGAHSHEVPKAWQKYRFQGQLAYSGSKGWNVYSWTAGYNEAWISSTKDAEPHGHSVTAKVTMSQEANLPPWYALCFIMKVKNIKVKNS
jgi:hypothetical protein